MEFRKDINSLRALAVITVVIFHFSPEILPGGFAGVDVFFVIDDKPLYYDAVHITKNGAETISKKILEKLVL
ncbi:acyltransferase family protein [Shewanella donghaensis]|uniref:acyltransferase family protein n=1 Tax=Shewanella donghaensis TaxID=238836 RepID=UPI001183AD0C|nr:hypothetical protein [Shewanella donghaensis]